MNKAEDLPSFLFFNNILYYKIDKDVDGSFSLQDILKGVWFLKLFPSASHQQGQEKDPKQIRTPLRHRNLPLCVEIHACISHSIQTNISFLSENPTVNSAAPSETKLFRGYSSRIKTSAERSHLSHFYWIPRIFHFLRLNPASWTRE